MTLQTKILRIERYALKTGAILTMCLSLGLPLATWGAEASGLKAIQSGVSNTAKGAGLTTGDKPASLTDVAGLLINAVLGLVGIILLAYMIYGGFRWMTARGDAKMVTEAQATIRNAVIGIVVIALAFALTSFVLGTLINATSSPTGGSVPGTGGT